MNIEKRRVPIPKNDITHEIDGGIKEYENEKGKELFEDFEQATRAGILLGKVILNYPPMGFVETEKFKGRIYLSDDGTLKTEIFDLNDSFERPKKVKEGPNIKLNKKELEALVIDVDNSVYYFENACKNDHPGFLEYDSKQLEESRRFKNKLTKMIEEIEEK